jgi:S-DNA-T family DNA segregation ATPase FtsK/SpoIIIE
MTEARALSIWDDIHLGVDERGKEIRVRLVERHLLVAGEPGAGKSVALNLIVAHAALTPDCRLVLVDGKRVELGLWRECADTFVGPSISEALEVLRRLQAEMDARYDELLAAGRRKITRASGVPVVLVVLDELPYFSATVGEAKQQKEFTTLLCDLVARGRAAGVVVVAATQRPSADILPTSLRDLFGYRWAFRCSTGASSDVILGHGWATQGYTAADIDPAARGAGWLIADGGIPSRMKAAYLSDHDVTRLAARAAELGDAQSGDEEAYAGLRGGFRGHFASKSRRYSTTLGAIRRERSDYRRRQAAEHVREIGDQADDETTLVVGRWEFAGLGYLTAGDAALALSAAARARERRQAAREHTP